MPPAPENIHRTDVVICGSGSAGLTAALWLAKYGVDFRILEKCDGPLGLGRADGVQCRTVEIFESFGIAEALLREAYHVLELAFWAPDPREPLEAGGVGGGGCGGDVGGSSGDDGDGDDGGPVNKGGIKRSHFAPDTEPGLSHQPHVILNQGRINEMIANEMLQCGGTGVLYGYQVQNVQVDAETAEDPDAYPVTVTASKAGAHEMFQAKYVLGCDGAHSAVRKSLGIKMIGDSTNAIWGVADVFPRTNFPDIRKKSVIQSTSGTLIIIPREGDAMVRLYIEFPPETNTRDLTQLDIHERARLIFRPYELDVAETRWWSAYAIGQRLADRFHDGRHRVLLTGDACHTHSPKAGQGMNLSLQDGYNIGWKLGAYLSGRAGPALVATYVGERHKTAAELIDFDREWSKIFKSSSSSSSGARGIKETKEHGAAARGDPNYVRDAFVKAGRYMAGQAYSYDESIIVWPSTKAAAVASPERNAEDATQLVVGMRFPSAQVVRFSDARVFQLLTLVRSDCRWRIFVFDGDIQQDAVQRRLRTVASSIQDLVRNLTPKDDDIDSVIEALLVLKTKRVAVDISQIPDIFMPVTGTHQIKSLHKVFFDDTSYNSGHGHAFDTLGITSQRATIAVVRPDQFISMVVSEDEIHKLEQFFDGFMLRS